MEEARVKAALPVPGAPLWDCSRQTQLSHNLENRTWFRTGRFKWISVWSYFKLNLFFVCFFKSFISWKIWWPYFPHYRHMNDLFSNFFFFGCTKAKGVITRDKSQRQVCKSDFCNCNSRNCNTLATLKALAHSQQLKLEETDWHETHITVWRVPYTKWMLYTYIYTIIRYMKVFSAVLLF